MSGSNINTTQVINQCSVSLEIELLVSQLIVATQALDPMRAVYDQPNPFGIQLCLSLRQALPRFLSIYQDGLFDYSEHLDAFFYGCESSGVAEIWRQRSFFGLASIPDTTLQYLVNAIVVFTRTDAFKRRQHDRHYEIEQYCESLTQYNDATANSFARLLSVRVDFYYYEKDKDKVSVHEVFEHLHRLSSLINRRRGLFSNLASYCRVVEQATDTGFHIHFGFLFKGHHHQNAFYLVSAMHKLWQEITADRGYCRSSNKDEAKFEALGISGIGMVRRDDLDKRHRMLGVMQYMAKLKTKPQHLRIKPKRLRVFAKGQFPD